MEFQDQENWFTVGPNSFRNINIPIIYSAENKLVLPARSEVIRTIDVYSKDIYVLIPNQELKPGIIIASAIVDTENAIIRIRNTTSKDAIVDSADIKSESLHNSDVYNANEKTAKNFKSIKPS